MKVSRSMKPYPSEPLMTTLHSAHNARIADALDHVGDLYDAQNGDAFRVRAYRSAASAVRELDVDVAELWSREGIAGLQQLPHVGPQTARAIEELVRTGRLMLLERLRGELQPERAFALVPGIGKELARRIHEHLHIATLEELESAANDGRLEAVPGFGARRVTAVREVLDSLLRRRRFAVPSPGVTPPRPRPSVGELLEVDARYRADALRGALPKIAPRRFNPKRAPWLPILHMERDGMHYTALFSNTALAHKLGTTNDWVVIFYENPSGEGQCTVVTERRGPLTGQRVVRGRELECERHYGTSKANVRDRSPAVPAARSGAPEPNAQSPVPSRSRQSA